MAVKQLSSGKKVYSILVASTASGWKTAPGQVFLSEAVLPACGKEKVFMRPEIVEEYRPVGYKYNITLSEEQINCKGTDCLDVKEFPISEGPLVSDTSFCPVLDFKIMHLDEKGVPTHYSDQEVKIEKDSTGKVVRMES